MLQKSLRPSFFDVAVLSRFEGMCFKRRRNDRQPMVKRVADGSFRVTRVQGNVVARRERQLLNWLCEHLPAAVTPDHLTLFSVVGAFVVFCSYVASRSQPGFLWLASIGLLLNWFGDSLDGSLARYRRIERPIYGYFLDHTVDAFNNLLIMAGLGFTRDVSMAAALFALIGYFLLCIYVFINNHLSGVMRLSFLWGGPTELRAMIIGINTAMFFAPRASFAVGTASFTPYEALVVFAGAVMTLIFAYRVVTGIFELRHPSRSGAAMPSAAQSSSMKPSRLSK